MPWGEFFVLADRDLAVSLNSWHQIAIQVQGEQLRVSVDNNPVFDLQDSFPLLSGSIAFEALDNSQIYVDDVVVESLE